MLRAPIFKIIFHPLSFRHHWIPAPGRATAQSHTAKRMSETKHPLCLVCEPEWEDLDPNYENVKENYRLVLNVSPYLEQTLKSSSYMFCYVHVSLGYCYLLLLEFC